MINRTKLIISSESFYITRSWSPWKRGTRSIGRYGASFENFSLSPCHESDSRQVAGQRNISGTHVFMATFTAWKNSSHLKLTEIYGDAWLKIPQQVAYTYELQKKNFQFGSIWNTSKSNSTDIDCLSINTESYGI